jgi:sulfatase modifying factor 1
MHEPMMDSKPVRAMDNIELVFQEIDYIFPMVFVEGTKGNHYLFGPGNDAKKVTIKDFFISQYTVTQKLYAHLMGHNPANNKANKIPVECVSYDEITAADGFLSKINSAPIKEQVRNKLGNISCIEFRLPSETEWEYAAKGGIHWEDNFIYSGSNLIDEVAWYKDNSFDESEPVGEKKPNQLGIYDMSGNVWEWCQDYYHPDRNKIPGDGTACLEQSSERVLRGGCFHNWAMHCTTTKRYEIGQQYKDPCIGFRLVLSF